MATWDDVVAATADLPGIEQSTSYGTPALKTKGKLVCRLWSDREHARDDVHDTEVLVVFCELDEKPMLIDGSAGVLFETPHYHGYGGVLIRLADVGIEDLADQLEHSYRLRAPKSLLKQLDAQ